MNIRLKQTTVEHTHARLVTHTVIIITVIEVVHLNVYIVYAVRHGRHYIIATTHKRRSPRKGHVCGEHTLNISI